MSRRSLGEASRPPATGAPAGRRPRTGSCREKPKQRTTRWCDGGRRTTPIGWWFAIPALVFLALAWGIAVLVYTTAPRRIANRLLAVILFLEGVTVAAPPLFITHPDTRMLFAASVLADVAWSSLPFLYLAFLGAALETPVTRRLRNSAVRGALVALALATAAIVVAFPRWFVREIAGQDPYGRGTWIYEKGWGEVIATVAVFVVAVFGLAAAVVAYRRAPRGGAARTRARSFLLAFGLRDTVFILLFGILWVFEGFGPESETALARSDPWAAASMILILIVLLIAYALLLAYGLLKGQLLDVDVKIKWTIRRGSVAAVFLAVFFVVAQIAQNWLDAEYGYLVGGIATGVLLLAIAPIQSAAERLAERAMPEADESAAYIARRKLQVYRAALEGALEDGAITDKERKMLHRLAAELVLSPEDMVALEREVASGATRSRDAPTAAEGAG